MHFSCLSIDPLATLGDRAFPVVAARAWNGLPDYVTSASTYASFRTALKMYLFSRTIWHWQHASHWLCNVVLKRCCACTTLIWSYDDDADDDDDDDDDCAYFCAFMHVRVIASDCLWPINKRWRRWLLKNYWTLATIFYVTIIVRHLYVYVNYLTNQCVFTWRIIVPNSVYIWSETTTES